MKYRGHVKNGVVVLDDHVVLPEGTRVRVVESALLTGEIDEVLTRDPRGTRYIVMGVVTDQETLVAVVSRFVEHDRLLIITVYEIK